MALRQKVLVKKAEKFELKTLQKILLDQEQLLKLEKLLDEAYAIRRPKPNEYEHRKQLIRVFNEIAKELYGNTSNCPVIKEFGSFSMDLFTTGSDLDLSINFESRSAFPRDQQIRTLRKFARKLFALQNGGHVRGVQPIMNAKVPIVKVIDAGTGVECDISVENRDGISKSEIIHLITKIDERFHKLSFLMKAWAKAHDINSSKDRTLNSLSIILLVAFHLQTRNPPILPPFSDILKDGEDVASVKKSVRNFKDFGKENTETLSELFMSFLIKLASVEKLWAKGLCASPYLGQWTSKTWNTKIASMSVEDFTDRTQNVARAVGKSEVETIYHSVNLTIKHLVSFMDSDIGEPKLKEYLFDVNKPHPHHKSVEPKPNLHPSKRKERSGRNQNPHSNWPTMPPPPLPPTPVNYWSGPQHVPVPESLWVDQRFDHQPNKRMRVAEGWGGPRWGSGWSGASPPTGGWGGGGSVTDHHRMPQEMWPVEDSWGRMLQQPPPGNSAPYGPPFR